MATNVLDYLGRIKTINTEEKINKVVKGIVIANKDQIVDVNKINLDAGKNNEDRIVGSYSPETENWAKASSVKPNFPKTPGSTFNFNWTGQFINGIFITYTRNKIKFFSKGMGGFSKTDFIIKEKLLGVSEKGADIINSEIIKPQLQERIKNILDGR